MVTVGQISTRFTWVICMLGAAATGWGQDAAPAEEASVSPPEETIIEISRPGSARATLLSTDYLGRVVTARQTPRVSSVVQRATLEKTIAFLKGDQPDSARASWTECTTDIAKVSPDSELESFILYILNRSFLQSSPDLTMSAEKVRFFNEQLLVIQQHIGSLQKHQSAYSQKEKSRTTIKNLSLTSYVPGGTVVRSRESEEIAWEDLGPRIATWERSLDDVGEEAQLAMYDLQGVMAEQIVAVQAMSNASEMMHSVIQDNLQEGTQ